MIPKVRLAAAFGLLFLSVSLVPEPCAGEELAAPKELQIALPRTLFRDIPEKLLNIAGKTYQSLMQSRIGIPGNVVHLPDSMHVADSLQKGEMHLGVFQGFEFAWAKAKHPELEALVVAVPVCRNIQGCFVVPATCNAKTLADLRGGKVAIPLSAKDHVRVYCEKLQNAEAANGAVCEITVPKHTDDALEDLIEGNVAGAFVDVAALASFADNKPGRFKRLRVVCESDLFPPGIIAFKRGGIDPATLKKCREGLLKSETDVTAAAILQMIKLKGFDAVPPNLDEVLKKSLEAYPAPVVIPAAFKP